MGMALNERGSGSRYGRGDGSLDGGGGGNGSLDLVDGGEGESHGD